MLPSIPVETTSIGVTIVTERGNAVKRLTESNVLTWPIFYDPDDSGGDKFFCHFIWTLIAGMAGTTAIGVAVSVTSNYALWFLMIIPILIAVFAPPLGTKHVLYGLYNDHYLYDYAPRLRFQAERYLSLSKTDRALYPPNILEIIKDPLLKPKQRAELDKAMNSVYSEICARDAARAELTRRYPNVDDVIAALEDSKQSVAVETQTYREYRE